MEQKEKKRRLKCCRKKTGKYLAVDGGHSHKKRSQIATLLQHVFLLTLQTN